MVGVEVEIAVKVAVEVAVEVAAQVAVEEAAAAVVGAQKESAKAASAWSKSLRPAPLLVAAGWSRSR